MVSYRPRRVMQLNLLKSKIHRAEITDSSLNYEGSLAVDSEFMAAVGLRPYERILIGNLNNGERFETYAIAAPAGSKSICLNGATAYLGKPGDLVTIDAPGGGGYGDPLEREPEMVQADVVEGYVSVESARNEYGVVINPETMEIDWEATNIIKGSRGPGFKGSSEKK